MHKKTSNKKTKTTILILATIGLIGACLVLYMNLSNDKNSTTTEESDSFISYDEPTEDEIKAGEAIKEDSISKTDPVNNDPAQDSTDGINGDNEINEVTPIISTWGLNGSGGYEISAFIPEIVETDGICTLTITYIESEDNMPEIQFFKEARADAQSTICGVFELSKDQLFNNNGTWSVKINYESSASIGVSDSVEMEINL